VGKEFGQVVFVDLLREGVGRCWKGKLVLIGEGEGDTY
jgi:hypothetical protein